MSSSDDRDALAAFLAALTDLSNRHGIAVDSGTQLFVMETEDRLFNYGADAESRLTRV